MATIPGLAGIPGNAEILSPARSIAPSSVSVVLQRSLPVRIVAVSLYVASRSVTIIGLDARDIGTKVVTNKERYRTDPEYRAKVNAARSAASKERYRTDPEYRAKIGAANRARYHQKMKNDPEFVKRNSLRSRISTARNCIRHHEERADFFRSRLEHDLKLFQKLNGKLPECLNHKRVRIGREGSQSGFGNRAFISKVLAIPYLAIP